MNHYIIKITYENYNNQKDKNLNSDNNTFEIIPLLNKNILENTKNFLNVIKSNKVLIKITNENPINKIFNRKLKFKEHFDKNPYEKLCNKSSIRTLYEKYNCSDKEYMKNNISFCKITENLNSKFEKKILRKISKYTNCLVKDDIESIRLDTIVETEQKKSCSLNLLNVFVPFVKNLIEDGKPRENREGKI